MQPRRWTPEDEEYLLAHYQTRTLKQIAIDLGRSQKVVSRRLGWLIAAGKANARLRFYNPRWTPEEIREAQERLRRPHACAAFVGPGLGRSPRALYCALFDHDLKVQEFRNTAGILYQVDVLRALGLKWKAQGQRWEAAGALRVHRQGVGTRARWVIYPADFIEFLTTRPDLYDADRMPRTLDGKPNPWLVYARRPASIATLSCKQVARELGVDRKLVQEWARLGRLPATRGDGVTVSRHEWLIPEEAVKRWKQQRTP